MMAPKTNPILNQWILLYEEYPLLRHFKIEDIVKCDNLLNVPFYFKDQSDELFKLSNSELSYALDYINNFLSQQDYNFRYLIRYDIPELTDRFIPKRKKIKALWNTQLKTFSSVLNVYFFAVAKQLMNKGFNPDLLQNQLEDLISVLDVSYKHDLSSHLLLIDDLKIKNSVIDFLQDFYTDKRIIRLFFYGYIIKGEKNQLTELERVLLEFKSRNISVPEECLPNKPKTFNEIFGPIVATFDEENILLTENFTLRHWERIKKFNNQNVIIQGCKSNIKIPESRHELVSWGRRFQNCVGYKEQYIQEIQMNDGIMFFVMRDDYPMYCVFYCESFKNPDVFDFEAKCMSNEPVFDEEYSELLNLAKQIYKYEPIIFKIKRMILGSKNLYELACFSSKFSF